APDHGSHADSPPTSTCAAGQPASTKRSAPRHRWSPGNRAADPPHQQRQQTRSACARPPRSRSSPRLLPLGATDERTGLDRGKLPSSYQATLDSLGKATATQHWQVSPRGDLQESSQPPPTRVSARNRTTPV